MLTAKINPVQFIVIRMAVSDKNKIFLVDWKILKNSLIFPVDIIMNSRNIKDQKPLWKDTSIAGINLISLKNSGCGIPQKSEARTV